MNNHVNWYYCHNCKKDVSAKLEMSIEAAIDYSHIVRVTIEAICSECGESLSSTEVEVVVP